MINKREQSSSEIMSQEQAFTDAIIHVFTEAGYTIDRELRHDDFVFDIIARNSKKELAVEVKYMSQTIGKTLYPIEHAIQRLVNYARKNGMIPVLVLSQEIKSEVRKHYAEEYEGLVILDVSNLLYVANNDRKAYEVVISSLPGVVDGIKPEKPDSRLKLNWLAHVDECNSIVRAFETCPAGKKGAYQFEDVCFSALRYALSDDLTLWKRQTRSNSDMFRFDLVCRIKDGNQKSFWKILEHFFSTKYIVFEFKNHRGQITQGEVFTTERYLYTKALRTVGIIIAANGTDKNSEKAVKGVLRETGKLIILLDKKDLINMCKKREEDDDPTNLLMDKLDKLLFELEKLKEGV